MAVAVVAMNIEALPGVLRDARPTGSRSITLALRGPSAFRRSAQDPPPHLVADGARGLLGHRLRDARRHSRGPRPQGRRRGVDSDPHDGLTCPMGLARPALPFLPAVQMLSLMKRTVPSAIKTLVSPS